MGSHTGLKGHSEAIRIFSKASVSNATLLIVANDFGGGCGRTCSLRKTIFNAWPHRRTDGKRIVVTALSRAETVAAYQTADLFLFPSNIECSPLVLFECMASHTPFLTTDVGNSAEIVEWSGGGMLLPTRTDAKGRSWAHVPTSSKMLSERFCDRTGNDRLAESGYAAWRERFTWSRIARDYEALYKNFCRSGRP